ncbi:hypothetical protein B2G51_11510 [Leptospira santarosai]|nr:hypothetical protein B2G51_11510 [Leptospira santarosai]
MERLEKARTDFVGTPTSYGKTQKAIFRRNMWELPRIVINLTTDSFSGFEAGFSNYFIFRSLKTF